MVPVGPIHVQVDLSDVGGESSGSGLQFLKMSQETGEENIKISLKASLPRSNLVKVLLLLLYFGNVEQETPHLPPQLQRNSLIDPPDQLEGSTPQQSS